MDTPNISGRLNKINRKIIKKIVHLNTKFRDNYFNTSSSNFSYHFPISIKNAISIRIQSIDIPNTCYLISAEKGNNIFYIEIDKHIDKRGSFPHQICKEIDTELYKIIIPEGNYNGKNLTAYLNQTYFYKATGETENKLRFIKFSINKMSLKSSFELISTAPKNFHYNIKFATDETHALVYTMGWILGFRMGEYINITQKLTSEGLFNAAGDKYIYVSINDYNTSRDDNNLVALDKNFFDKDILGKIYLKNGKFNINIDDEDNISNLKKRTFHGPLNFNKISIKLYNEYGNIYHLNNMDYSFALEFEILYENWCY